MQDLMDFFFGPLGTEYCGIFFVYTIFSLITLIISIVMTVISVFKRRFNWTSIGLIVVNFILYIQLRLLYNMCLSRNM